MKTEEGFEYNDDSFIFQQKTKIKDYKQCGMNRVLIRHLKDSAISTNELRRQLRKELYFNPFNMVSRKIICGVNSVWQKLKHLLQRLRK